MVDREKVGAAMTDKEVGKLWRKHIARKSRCICGIIRKLVEERQEKYLAGGCSEYYAESTSFEDFGIDPETWK